MVVTNRKIFQKMTDWVRDKLDKAQGQRFLINLEQAYHPQKEPLLVTSLILLSTWLKLFYLNPPLLWFLKNLHQRLFLLFAYHFCSFTYLITWFFVWVCFCFCKWFRMIKFKLLHWYLHSWSKLVLKYGPMHCESSRESTLHKQACLCSKLSNQNSGSLQEDMVRDLIYIFINIGLCLYW